MPTPIAVTAASFAMEVERTNIWWFDLTESRRNAVVRAEMKWDFTRTEVRQALDEGLLYWDSTGGWAIVEAP